jgi:methyl-accepting chemotaxis protein
MSEWNRVGFLTGPILCAQETHEPVKRSKNEKNAKAHAAAEVAHAATEVAHATPEEAHATPEVAHATPEVAHATPEEAHDSHATAEVGEAAAEETPETSSWMAELKDVKTTIEKIVLAHAVLESKVEDLRRTKKRGMSESSNEVSDSMRRIAQRPTSFFTSCTVILPRRTLPTPRRPVSPQ